jgi:Domain of unknown function (DUF6457)
VHEWLDSARVRLARAVGDDPSAYELDEDDVADILDLARVAAHESGERTNAPLLSYLVGLARARHPDRELTGLVDDTVGNR